MSNLLWVYLIWTVIVALHTNLIDGQWHSVLQPYYAPENSLWYIAGLMFCLLLARLMRPLSHVAQLSVAVLLFAASFIVSKLPISDLTFAYETIIRLFIFFLIGALFGGTIVKVVNAHYWLLLPFIVLGLGVMLVLRLNLGVTVFGISLACTLSAIVAAYMPRLKQVFSMMGMYSLGILCTHMLILHTMTLLPGLPGPGANFWGVPLAVVLAVAGSIWFYRLTDAPPLLWKAPEFFKTLRFNDLLPVSGTRG